MPPLVIDFEESDSDSTSFVTSFEAFFEDEVFTHQQIGVYNITKLKITTLVESHHLHTQHVNQVKLRSGKEIAQRGAIAKQQANVMEKVVMETEHNKAIKKMDNPIPYDVMVRGNGRSSFERHY